MKKQISYKIVSLVFSILVLCFAIAFYAVGWDEPGTPPPSGNVDAPLNTGNTTQYKSGALGIGGVFRTDSETVLAVLSGNVGIGTPSPDQKLQVIGNVMIGETDVIGGSLYLYGTTAGKYSEIKTTNGNLHIDAGFGAGGDNGIYLNYYAGASASILLGTGTNKQNVYFNTNGIWNASGNVGIGTTNPLIDLAIGDTDTGINQDGDGVLELWTNNVDRLHITNSGNVGIGTITPSEKLDVAGSIIASGTICDSGGANCIGGGGGATYDSGWFAVSANNTYVKAHGLGVIPKSIDVYLSDKNDASRTYYVKSGVPTFNADAYSYGTYVWKVTSTQITIVASQRLTQTTGWTPVVGWARIIAIE